MRASLGVRTTMHGVCLVGAKPKGKEASCLRPQPHKTRSTAVLARYESSISLYSTTRIPFGRPVRTNFWSWEKAHTTMNRPGMDQIAPSCPYTAPPYVSLRAQSCMISADTQKSCLPQALRVFFAMRAALWKYGDPILRINASA